MKRLLLLLALCACSGAPCRAAVVTILSDGFESIPNTNWALAAPSGYSAAMWNYSNYRAATGTYSAYCCASLYPAPGPYPAYMDALMWYGPFNLADAVDGSLSLQTWVNCESNYDYVGYYVSTDAFVNVGGYEISGNYSTYGWIPLRIAFTNVPGLGTVCGKSKVWFGVYFYSDDAVQYEGAYVDNVLIQKTTSTNRAPFAPANQLPVNGAAGLTWNPILAAAPFSDPDPASTHAASQWQWATDTLFTNANDSGETLPSTSIWVAVSAQTRWYWRVRYKDDAGLWSAWSAPTWFQTTNLPAPALALTDYQFRWRTPDNPNNWYYHEPQDIAAGPQGRLYVADRLNHRVLVLSTNGVVLSSIGSYGTNIGQFIQPMNIAVDNNGVIYVADYGNSRIQVLDSNGAFLYQWGSYGTNAGAFRLPDGIALDGSGNVYVADQLIYRIQVFTTNGAFVRQWGSQGSANGQFNGVNDVAADSGGNVYVADGLNNRIQVFNNSGAYLRQWPSYLPLGLCFDSGELYVAQELPTNQTISVYSPLGALLRSWGGTGSSPGQFDGVDGVTKGSDGRIYTIEAGNLRAQVFTTAGVFVAQWNASGAGNGEFNRSQDAAVDSNGRVFISDLYNYRVQVLNSNGTYSTKWGSPGTNNGQFVSITGIAIDGANNVYVCDAYRIQKFSNAGGFLDSIDANRLGTPFSPCGLDIAANGDLYVSDLLNNRLLVISSAGALLNQWGSFGMGQGQFNRPTSLALDNSNVYIADQRNHRVQVFTKTGAFVRSWIVYAPVGIALGNDTNVYVTSGEGGSVHVYTKNGDTLGQFGSFGVANGQFDYPNGLTFDSANALYVCEQGNSRIVRFEKAALPQTSAFLRASGSAAAVDVSWAPAANAAGYLLVRDGALIASLSGAVTNYSDADAAAGALNHYTLVATNTLGRSALQAVNGARLDTCDPADDTPAGASALTPLDGPQTHGPHTLGAADPADWYHLSVLPNNAYYFDSIGGEGDVLAELYSGGITYTKVAEDDNSGGNGQFALAYRATAVGDYYLRVRLNPAASAWAGPLHYRKVPSLNLPPTVTVAVAVTNLPCFGAATLTALGNDPESQPLTYEWSEDGDNPMIGRLPSRATAQVITQPLRRPGTYRFYVIVNDGEWNSAPAAMTVNVPGLEGTVLCEGFSGYVPLWGVEVTVSNPVNPLSEYTRAVTDARGAFILDTGGAMQPVLDVRRNTTPSTTILQPVPNDGLRSVTIHYTPLNFNINGRVVDQAASPLAATVQILLGNGLTAYGNLIGSIAIGQVPETWAPSVTVAYPYKLRIQREGYRSRVEDFYVRGSQNNVTRNFELLAEPLTASLSGYVYTQSNYPVAGATVDLGLWQTTTAADGTFSFTNVAKGDYCVRITAIGFDPYVSPDTWSSVNPTHEPFFIEGGDVLVQGTIMDDTGHPVTNATVSVVTPLGATRALCHARLASTRVGSYAVVIGKGARQLRLSAPGYDPFNIDVQIDRPQQLTLTVPEPALALLAACAAWLLRRPTRAASTKRFAPNRFPPSAANDNIC